MISVREFGYLSCKVFEKFHRLDRVSKDVKRFNFSIQVSFNA